MQVNQDQLKRQQEIMAARGFYTGKLDGVWGPRTVQAKVRWEGDPSFLPGLPNHGMPLADVGPWPSGISKNAQGLLECPILSAKRHAETKAEVVEETADPQSDSSEHKRSNKR